MHILSGVQAALKIRILKGNHLAPFQDHLKGQLTAPRPLHVKQQKKKKKKKKYFLGHQGNDFGYYEGCAQACVH